MKSIGQSNSFCWVIEEGLEASDIVTSFPYYTRSRTDVILEEGEEWGSTSETVPKINHSRVRYCNINLDVKDVNNLQILFQGYIITCKL